MMSSMPELQVDTSPGSMLISRIPKTLNTAVCIATLIPPQIVTFTTFMDLTVTWVI